MDVQKILEQLSLQGASLFHRIRPWGADTEIIQQGAHFVYTTRSTVCSKYNLMRACVVSVD